MQQPSQQANTFFKEFVQEIPSNFEESARKFKAFTRSRKIPNVQELMRVVFLYCGLDQTFREIAGTMSLLHEKITDSSIRERLLICQPWIKAVLKEMFVIKDLPKLQNNYRFLLIDGTTTQAPGAKGVDYRIHVTIDLLTLEFVDLTITDKYIGESLNHYQLKARDIVIADRGYSRHPQIAESMSNGADVIVRVHMTSIQIRDLTLKKIDLVQELEKNEHKQIHSFEVVLTGSKSPQKCKGRIHALKLPEEKANIAKMKLRKNSRSKYGREPTEESLYLRGWMMVFTSLTEEILPSESILALYRLRWQVELSIKRLKSLLGLDKLRARRNGAMASVWLYGKLLYAIVLEKKSNGLSNPKWMNLDRARKETPWRIIKMVKEVFDASVILVGFWEQERWEEALEVLRERPRRRKLQQIPPAAIELLAKTCSSACSKPSGDAVVSELFNQKVEAFDQVIMKQKAA